MERRYPVASTTRQGLAIRRPGPRGPAQRARYGLVGSMARRGNPYDNAMMQSFMKTL